ncbi:MAG: hypothetical protein ACRD5G_16435, partial [Candidatus Acidiferrales bacterium]
MTNKPNTATQIAALQRAIGGVIKGKDDAIALAVMALLAPGAVATMPTREVAGNVVGMALARLHLLGYACGALYLAASVIAGRSVSGLARPATICVIAMLLLTAVSHHGINAKLADLRGQMSTDFGSVDATPRDHP